MKKQTYFLLFLLSLLCSQTYLFLASGAIKAYAWSNNSETHTITTKNFTESPVNSYTNQFSRNANINFMNTFYEDNLSYWFPHGPNRGTDWAYDVNFSVGWYNDYDSNTDSWFESRSLNCSVDETSGSNSFRIYAINNTWNLTDISFSMVFTSNNSFRDSGSWFYGINTIDNKSPVDQSNGLSIGKNSLYPNLSNLYTSNRTGSQSSGWVNYIDWNYPIYMSFTQYALNDSITVKYQNINNLTNMYTQSLNGGFVEGGLDYVIDITFGDCIIHAIDSNLNTYYTEDIKALNHDCRIVDSSYTDERILQLYEVNRSWNNFDYSSDFTYSVDKNLGNYTYSYTNSGIGIESNTDVLRYGYCRSLQIMNTQSADSSNYLSLTTEYDIDTSLRDMAVFSFNVPHNRWSIEFNDGNNFLRLECSENRDGAGLYSAVVLWEDYSASGSSTNFGAYNESLDLNMVFAYGLSSNYVLEYYYRIGSHNIGEGEIQLSTAKTKLDLSPEIKIYSERTGGFDAPDNTTLNIHGLRWMDRETYTQEFYSEYSTSIQDFTNDNQPDTFVGYGNRIKRQHDYTSEMRYFNDYAYVQDATGSENVELYLNNTSVQYISAYIEVDGKSGDNPWWLFSFWNSTASDHTDYFYFKNNFDILHNGNPTGATYTEDNAYFILFHHNIEDGHSYLYINNEFIYRRPSDNIPTDKIRMYSNNALEMDGYISHVYYGNDSVLASQSLYTKEPKLYWSSEISNEGFTTTEYNQTHQIAQPPQFSDYRYFYFVIEYGYITVSFDYTDNTYDKIAYVDNNWYTSNRTQPTERLTPLVEYEYLINPEVYEAFLITLDLNNTEDRDFKYGTYNNFNATHYGEATYLHTTGNSLTITFTYDMLWSYYLFEREKNTIETFVEFIAPLIILFIFPITLYGVWGRKGFGAGMLVGIGVMALANFISVGFAIILEVVAVMFLVMIYIRERGGNNGMG